MAKATTSIVIYRPENKAIIATVQVNERYYLAKTDLIFNGLITEFQAINPDYKMLHEVITNNSNNVPFTVQ